VSQFARLAVNQQIGGRLALSPINVTNDGRFSAIAPHQRAKDLQRNFDRNSKSQIESLGKSKRWQDLTNFMS
jgi:hypothetical protein